jgi:uncharacterized protein
MKVPYEQLQPETLRALIEEFVTRSGTDYGTREASLESKVAHVMGLLKAGKAQVVFDAESETCDIHEASRLQSDS